MRALLETLRTKRSARGLVTVLAGGLTGQGLVVLASPLLTRIYDPSDFGLLGVFTALVAMLTVMSTWRLELAIPLPKEDGDAAAVAWAALSLTAVAAAVVGLVGAFFGESVAALLDAPGLDDVWWLVALSVAALGIAATISAWLVRTQAYGLLGGRNALQGVAQVSTQIGLGLAGAGAPGLLLGLPVGRLFGVGGLLTRGGLLRQRLPTMGAVRAGLSRYRRFPLVSSWAALINSAGLQIPVLLISGVYGQASAGLFALAVRIVVAPTVLIGQAVSDVFVGEVGNLVRGDAPDVERTLRSTAARLLAIGIVPALVVVVAGPWAFAHIFGAEWASSGTFAQLLVLGYLGQFVVAPTSQILSLAEKQTWGLAWDITRAVLVIGGLLLCIALGGSVTAAVATMSVTALASYVLLYVVGIRAARSADRAIVRRQGPDDPFSSLEGDR